MAEGLFSKIKGWVIDEEEEEIYEEEMEDNYEEQEEVSEQYTSIGTPKISTAKITIQMPITSIDSSFDSSLSFI